MKLSLSILKKCRVPLALIVVWEAATQILQINERLLPAPSAILIEVFSKAQLLLAHGLDTLFAVVLGFAASALVGVMLGMVLTSNRWLEAATFPLLVFSQTVPKIAIAPLLMIWFGFGIESKVLVTFLIAFFPILIDTMVGLRALPNELLQFGRSTGAKRLTIYRKFRLPYALPFIFGGFRIGAVFSVTGTVVAEFVGAEDGLVYLLLVAMAQHQSALVFTIVLIVTLLSVTLFLLVERVERLVIPWYVMSRQDPS